ncbi:MAG: type II toxin-antitoxin system PemK/MazF family toxin [Acidobacteria bacterium]|nr:type II toxin-antitoxin system PemK/MazF family toxin [Acidobacteriota bacterium]MYG74962.1 type II toxin-antitoxin system PemK/MazF family toxin [Acidobacteriota bacterium]
MVVVLARNGAIPFLPAIMVAPVTTVVRGLPSEVSLQAELGLRAPAVVNLDAVMTVSRARLGGLAGRLSDERLKQVGAALRVATGSESDEHGAKPAS